MLRWLRRRSISRLILGGAAPGAPLLALFEKWALMDERGSALLEFAITLPLLVVFVVGIYDFSGAFNQKQKIEQAAQEGAIIAGAQPMSDIADDHRQPGLSATGGDRNFQLAGRQRSAAKRNLHATRYGIRTGRPGSWTYTVSGCSTYPPTIWSSLSTADGYLPHRDARGCRHRRDRHSIHIIGGSIV